MAYTVKQVAAMSGVSVRALHFYDETGLLKPAYHGANSYRFYEEPQLLTLQQILFYRELGFELKEIKRILDRPDFQNVAALESHRQVLVLTRWQVLESAYLAEEFLHLASGLVHIDDFRRPAAQFSGYGMDLLSPHLIEVDEDRRITQIG